MHVPQWACACMLCTQWPVHYVRAATTWPHTWLLSWDEVRLASSTASPAPDGGGGVASIGAADVAESLGLAGLEPAAAAAAVAVAGCAPPGGAAAVSAGAEDAAAKGETAPSGLSPASAVPCAWLLAAAACCAAGSRSGVFSCGKAQADRLTMMFLGEFRSEHVRALLWD